MFVAMPLRSGTDFFKRTDGVGAVRVWHGGWSVRLS